MQTSGRVDDDMRITALDAFFGKDRRRSRYIGEVLERYRGEDAGDLKRIELVVDMSQCSQEGREEKSCRTWKSNQNIVMDEELVQNIVMDEEWLQNVVMEEKIVKNFVMGA